ncbi:MAG: hypothetical protein KGK18_02155, partial [Burkholderiales bacterium]|nr:hypothetical protein [Burkholderiales bacterium]
MSAEAAPPDEFRTFMVALATDPARLGAYIKDPDAAMRAAGISEVDQVILKSGQPWTIHARLSGQRFSFTPPTPSAMLVVDLVRPPGAPEGAPADQPAVRGQAGSPTVPNPGSSTMYPNAPSQILYPQIWPQVHPQLVIHPQIYPQVHPQLVIHPQIYPQVHPQLVIHPQI